MVLLTGLLSINIVRVEQACLDVYILLKAILLIYILHKLASIQLYQGFKDVFDNTNLHYHTNNIQKSYQRINTLLSVKIEYELISCIASRNLILQFYL